MEIAAFISFVVGAVLSGIGKAWAVCAVAVGLALELVPRVFH